MKREKKEIRTNGDENRLSFKKNKTKKKKWFKRLLLISLFFFFFVGMGTLFINIHVKSYVKADLRTVEQCEEIDADCIVVLGAGIWDENTPSRMLDHRIRTGVALYEAGASEKIIMSGDHGRKNYDEVNVMKDYAIKYGVPSEDIFMDHAGFSTYESMVRAKEIFGAKKIIVVTQEFHLSRAVYIAERLGLEAYGVSSDLSSYPGIEYNEMREVLARVKDFFMVIFQPNPTYLGEPISLSGSGDVTAG